MICKPIGNHLEDHRNEIHLGSRKSSRFSLSPATMQPLPRTRNLLK